MCFFIFKISVQFNLNQVLAIDMVLEKMVGKVSTEYKHGGKTFSSFTNASDKNLLVMTETLTLLTTMQFRL